MSGKLLLNVSVGARRWSILKFCKCAFREKENPLFGIKVHFYLRYGRQSII